MNNKSKEKRVAARNRVAARKASQLAAFPYQKSFEGFAGFVKKGIKQITIK